MKYLVYSCWILVCFSMSCQGELVIVPDNTAPDYSGVSTLKVQNYVNRLFIDLLGREPVDVEMDALVAELRAGELKKEVRETVVRRLMKSTDFVEGDTSYRHAYYSRLYDLMMVRFLEGAGDGILKQRRSMLEFRAEVDSLNGNMAGYQAARFEIGKLNDVLTSRWKFREGEITIQEMAGYMLFNSIYDEINMNSINFIRASFNDVLLRYHTQDEFDRAFPIIEFGRPGIIFGQSASNKLEYIQIMIRTRESYEAMIRWAYQALLARDPDAAEVTSAMEDFFQTTDFEKIQRNILVTDEYSRF